MEKLNNILGSSTYAHRSKYILTSLPHLLCYLQSLKQSLHLVGQVTFLSFDFIRVIAYLAYLDNILSTNNLILLCLILVHHIVNVQLFLTFA